MATKRISKHSADFNRLINAVNFWEAARFQKFRVVSQLYAGKVAQYPENPPAIDWNKYKSSVTNKEVVSKLEASYKAAMSAMPYPKDTYSEMITKVQEEAVLRVQNQSAKYVERNDECKQMIAKFEQMLPLHEMTIEEYARTFPDWMPHYKSRFHDVVLTEPTLPPAERELRANDHVEFNKSHYL
ncbi:ATP synthase subunit d, mitochondrial-like [Brevipalpus obovatus]|uniref:ATP synthase subunit d, mitochondrial-like n=1 Tax=Brevipalpus obovatus TaxID=246614 RepID=UPI003D9E9D15